MFKRKKPEDSLVMTNYADAFQETLKSENIHFSSSVNDDGDCIIRFTVSFDPNLTVRVTVVFDKSELLVRWFVYDYITAVPGDSIPQVIEKLNEFNWKLTHYKFYLDGDRDIVCSWFFPHFTKDMPFSPLNLWAVTTRMLSYLNSVHDDLYELSFGKTFERAEPAATNE